MFVKLTTLLFFTGFITTAQVTNTRHSTSFDNFTANKKIQWAAYTTDTFDAKTYSLGGILNKRLKNGEIRLYAPVTREGLMLGNPVHQLTKTELEQKSIIPVPTNLPGENSEALYVATSILYVEDSKLKLYVPWVTEKIPVHTSTGLYLGNTDHYSCCLNHTHGFSISKNRRLTFIGTKKRKILIDSIPKNDMLKETLGRNIVEVIWDNLIKTGNKMIDVRNDKNIEVKSLDDIAFPNPVNVPVYDSTGAITGYKVFYDPVSPSLFKQVEVEQNWYYDRKRNHLFGDITAVTLFWKNTWPGERDTWKPVIKILFK